MVYVSFVVDIYSRAIVGWSAATNKRTPLVLDALDMALWRRDRDGRTVQKGLIHHSDAGSQYTSFRVTTHLVDAGIDASIGTVGDALDNALMESTIGLYKTEVIKPRRPWQPSPRSSWPPPNGSTGTTITGCTPRSATPHQRNTNRCSTLTPPLTSR